MHKQAIAGLRPPHDGMNTIYSTYFQDGMVGFVVRL